MFGKPSMRVLIDDDQKGVGAVLRAMVSADGHQVIEVAGSGFEAIRAYHRHRPDVVLMACQTNKRAFLHRRGDASASLSLDEVFHGWQN